MYIWDNCKKTQFSEAIDNLKIEAIKKKINSVDVNVNEIVTDISSLWGNSASKTELQATKGCMFR